MADPTNGLKLDSFYDALELETGGTVAAGSIASGFESLNALDQFFDKEQFEAYRQLGVHVCEGLFLPAVTRGKRRRKRLKRGLGRWRPIYLSRARASASKRLCLFREASP
jgi:hypothetical protein